MAYPGFKATNDHPTHTRLIAHDQYGIPNSPLFGLSPRRPKQNTQHMEDNIEAIRDTEIKLMRGSIKPEQKPRNNNASSYDLISGIPTRRMTSDSEFDRIRDREMARQGYNTYDTASPPPPGSPIKADSHNVPASPLYRPGDGYNRQGQGHNGQGHGQDQGYNSRLQGYEPRDEHDPGMAQVTSRPATNNRDAGMPVQTPQHERSNQTPMHMTQQRESPDFNYDPRLPVGEFRPGADSSMGRLEHGARTPVYRPGQGKGLIMADPRTGSAIKGRMPWHENNEDDYTKLRMNNLNIRDTRDDFKPLDEFRDHRGNLVIKGFPPDSYRCGYGLSSDRGQNRPGQQGGRSDHGRGDVSDPRLGGNTPTGPGNMGARNGGALFFIKFPTGRGNLQVAGHAFLRAKTHDIGGRYLGMASRVVDFGYEGGSDEAIAVFHFSSMEKALLFFQTDNNLKQPDFPGPYGHAEMWIICNAYLPDNMSLFNTFLLSEIKLHEGKDKREFFETFQIPFENYLYKNGAMPFVICSYGTRDRQDIRRHCYPHSSIITCHLFQGVDHLNWITNDETYSKFRSLHNQMALEKCSIFQLAKDTGL